MNWDVYGHDWAVELLKRQLVNGRQAQAYLFSGPPGVGRRTLALALAQTLNCTRPPAEGEYCGECPACRGTARMQLPDLSVVQAETVGGTLKVDMVRELLRNLALTPHSAKWRVALLLRFHEASAGAQNALLKTLEEAPPKAVLMLTADSPEMLFPTIVSRCEVLRLRPAPVTGLAAALQERWHIPQQEAVRLAALSAGRTGWALHLHHHPEALEEYDRRTTDLLSLLASNRRSRLTYVDGIYKDRELVRQVFEIWLSFWRDVFLVAGGAGTPLLHRQHEQEIRQLASGIGLAGARACTADLERGLERLNANVNARLLTENILLRWPKFG